MSRFDDSANLRSAMIREAYKRERDAAWQAYIDRNELSDEGMRGEVLTAFEAGYDAAIKSFEPYAEVPK